MNYIFPKTEVTRIRDMLSAGMISLGISIFGCVALALFTTTLREVINLTPYGMPTTPNTLGTLDSFLFDFLIANMVNFFPAYIGGIALFLRLRTRSRNQNMSVRDAAKYGMKFGAVSIFIISFMVLALWAFVSWSAHGKYELSPLIDYLAMLLLLIMATTTAAFLGKWIAIIYTNRYFSRIDPG